MIVPEHVTIERLNGNWVLNKELSTVADPMLKLQKISWLLRKAYVIAPIHVQILQYPIKDAKSSQSITKIDFIQSTTAGFAGTQEERILDWRLEDHSDYVYGTVQTRSRFAYGVRDADGTIRPKFDLQTKTSSAEIEQFLRGEIEEDWTKSAGFLVEERDGTPGLETPGVWVHTFACNDKAGWTAEQIWGFEIIEGQRYFSRRVVTMATNGQYHCGRYLFDYAGV